MSKKFKHLKKNKKGFKRDVLHLFDHLFYEVYSKEQYILDLFRLVLTSEEFELFDWSTLQSRVTVFIDKAFRERRADVIFCFTQNKSCLWHVFWQLARRLPPSIKG